VDENDDMPQLDAADTKKSTKVGYQLLKKHQKRDAMKYAPLFSDLLTLKSHDSHACGGNPLIDA
jgi:hypothetical protein